jgi:hypothetical protein
MTLKVKNGCRKCGNDLYYYPAKLVLETTKEIVIGKDKRIISLCCSDGNIKHTLEYVFPEEFETI